MSTEQEFLTEEDVIIAVNKGIGLDEKELFNLVLDYGIETKYGENRRWTRSAYTIVELCHKYFRIDWEEGLTEGQENEFYCQPYEVEKHEYEKTITVKEWVKKNKHTEEKECKAKAKVCKRTE